MISLTTPSARYDPKALAAYCGVSETAPYAVPVSMNAGGDYFRSVVESAAQLIPYVRNAYAVGKQIYGIAKPVLNNVGAIFKDMRAKNVANRKARKAGREANKINKLQAGAGANPRK